MPRKKTAINNGGGLVSTAAKAANVAKALFNKIKNIRGTRAVHPDIPIHPSPSFTLDTPQSLIDNTPPTIVQEIRPISIIEIANKWMEDPKINPYTNADIELSIHPKSDYAKLYKKIIDKLIKYIYELFPEKEKLTIEDCKYIKNNLPIIHSIIVIEDEEYKKKYKQNYYIKYDHLFIKYFIKRVTKKYTYDIDFCKDNEIKLYLDIYNSIIEKKLSYSSSKSPAAPSSSPKSELPNYILHKASSSPKSPKLPNSKSPKLPTIDDNIQTSTEDLLKGNIDLEKSDMSIGNLVLDLCKDIRPILYIHETMMTIENYKIALNNKKRLEYVASLYKLGIVNGEIFKYINNYKYKQKIEGIENDELKELYYIFGEIDYYLTLNNINANDNILNKLKEINKIILSLYSSYFSKDIKNPILTADKIISSNDVVKLFPYCKEGEVDPFTTDLISGLDYNERKNVVNIILYDDISYEGKKKKVYYYCFDTITTYNYILGCIEHNINIKNLHTHRLFTDDELDEICDKMKYFTTRPIYHSHIDIKNAIAKQKGTYVYKDYLELSFEAEKDYSNLKEYEKNSIIGNYKIYINLNFGGVILRVINTYDKATSPLLNKNNSFVLSLPIFVGQKDVYVIKFIILTMQNSLRRGKYIKKGFFPYNDRRTGNLWDKIVHLPPFNYKLDDNAINVYIHFKKYIEDEKHLEYSQL